MRKLISLTLLSLLQSQQGGAIYGSIGFRCAADAP